MRTSTSPGPGSGTGSSCRSRGAWKSVTTEAFMAGPVRTRREVPHACGSVNAVRTRSAWIRPIGPFARPTLAGDACHRRGSRAGRSRPGGNKVQVHARRQREALRAAGADVQDETVVQPGRIEAGIDVERAAVDLAEQHVAIPDQELARREAHRGAAGTAPRCASLRASSW